MGAREARLWQWLRAAKLTKDLRRVENNVENGTPDIEGIVQGRMPFHIELKRAERPARPSTPIRIKFQPGQVDWLYNRWVLGGSCWVLLAVGQGARKATYLVRGDLAGDLQEGQTEAWIAKHSSLTTRTPTPEQVLLEVSDPYVQDFSGLCLSKGF